MAAVLPLAQESSSDRRMESSHKYLQLIIRLSLRKLQLLCQRSFQRDSNPRCQPDLSLTTEEFRVSLI